MDAKMRADLPGAGKATVWAALALMLSVAGCKNAPEPQGCLLTPVLMENFDSLSVAPYTIGPARWISHTPWNGDFGDARFTDDGPDGPFSIHDGILHITAKKDAEGKWTSGLLASADSTGKGRGAKYGYFEARMKMPTGPGTWPAFWLVEIKPIAQRDALVEIDVIEYYGHSTGDFQSVVHVWFDDRAKKFDDAVFIDVPKGSLEADFHTYGVDVSPTSVTYFLDGVEYWRHPTPPELDAPLHPLVNLALGSGWPIDKTPNPVVLKVDYIHVWERSATPPQGCKPGRGT
jgi:beta-glucanase (GH16 family)